MTWFRVEASLRDHTVLGVIAEALKVRPAEAAGLYILTLAGFAEHEPTGRPELVTDTDLEGWARWFGRRGRFAQLFRERFIERREDQRDPPGQIKGWWRQEALLREQERSRNRPGQGTRKALEGTDETAPGHRDNTAVPLRGNVDEDEDGNERNLLTNGAEPDLSPTRYTQLCTVACNRGMRENPLIRSRFNELAASGQDEPALWQAEGIPIAVAEAAIYHRSKAYRPSANRRQPTTLGYFRAAVKDAWEKAQGRALEGDVNTTPLPDAEEIDEYERVARQLEAKERAHAS